MKHRGVDSSLNPAQDAWRDLARQLRRQRPPVTGPGAAGIRIPIPGGWAVGVRNNQLCAIGPDGAWRPIQLGDPITISEEDH